jgi:general secretion pathway protein A
MYHQFYNFQIMPFENTPNPRLFFASEQHREALAAIEYTIRMRKGIVLVTGDVGSGKTTVCRTLLERCADQATVVQLVHGHENGFEVVRHVLRTLEISLGRNDDHSRMLQRLREYLVEQMHRNRPVVLCVDEAQTFTDAALDELRLLTNIDTNDEKLIQIALVGQPELRERIGRPRMAALRQRIVMARGLRPMNRQETGAYITHRLCAASVDPQNVGVTFTDGAVQAIYDGSGGTPRLTNVICDNCLLLGFVRELREIAPAIVRRVVDDMVPHFGSSSPAQDMGRPRLSLAGNF